MSTTITLKIRKEQITMLTGVAHPAPEAVVRYASLLEAYGQAKWDFSDRLYTTFGEGLYTFNASVWGPWEGTYCIMVHPHPDLDSRWVEETFEADGMREASIEARIIIERWLAHILTTPDQELIDWAKQRGPVPDPVPQNRAKGWKVDKAAGVITFGKVTP